MVNVIRRYLKGDIIIWGVVIALSVFSLIAVYSSTGTLAYKFQGGNTFYYFLKHSLFLLIGFLIIFITHHIPYKYYLRLSQLFLFIAVPLLVLTLFIGVSINQASRWVTLPGLGFTIQTSDFAKLAVIMYVARMLSLKQHMIDDFKGAFLPIVAPVAIVALLILPANLSTAIILFLVCLVLMFIGRIPFKYLFMLVLTGIIVLALFIGIAMITDYEGRINTWENRIESYISGESEDNYQVEQAKIAILNGGVLGQGPGNSIQRNYLPQPYSDFIYAIILEEYGMVGGFIILFLYLFLLFRAGVIVRKSDRTFPAFLAIGLTLLLVVQAMVNMGVAVNLFPVTGQTLPLVSMGGTSMLFTSVAIGIILSISRSNLTNDPDDAMMDNNYEETGDDQDEEIYEPEALIHEEEV